MLNSTRCKGPEVPKKITEQGGLILPMFQSEALCLRFESKVDAPIALKIALEETNLITNEVWNKNLVASPQDYLVCPPQTWLYGISNPQKGFVKEIAPPKLRDGSAVPISLQFQAIPLCQRDVKFSYSVPGLQKEAFRLNVGSSPKANGCSVGDIIWMDSPSLGTDSTTLADLFVGEESIRLKAFDKTVLCSVTGKHLTKTYELDLPSSWTVYQLKRDLVRRIGLGSSPCERFELSLTSPSTSPPSIPPFLNDQVKLSSLVTSGSNSVSFYFYSAYQENQTDWRCEVSPIIDASGSRAPTIFPDPYGPLFWDFKRSIRLFVHIVSTEMLYAWTKIKLSRPPIYPSKYTMEKLPFIPEFSEEEQVQLSAEELHRLNQAAKKERDVDIYTFVL
eukprot:TRINITY_DN3000_c0_g1_i1.p1 TRINITY_DN3000_c0_g1~~TRINITY_DN3000_c0_g1_i1.p1  ORF type:complete len:391 (-),score=44.74 TRINITY_DN3000_c0_g1_i1:344-1516(-)